MGLQGSKPEDTKKGKGAADLTAIHKEYYPAFEECKKNPDFFGNYLLMQLIISQKFQTLQRI